VVIILIIDHIKLRQETERLERLIVNVSNDGDFFTLQGEIDTCDSEISDLKDALESESHTIRMESEKHEKKIATNRENINVLFNKLGLRSPIYWLDN